MPQQTLEGTGALCAPLPILRPGGRVGQRLVRSPGFRPGRPGAAASLLLDAQTVPLSAPPTGLRLRGRGLSPRLEARELRKEAAGAAGF